MLMCLLNILLSIHTTDFASYLTKSWKEKTQWQNPWGVGRVNTSFSSDTQRAEHGNHHSHLYKDKPKQTEQWVFLESLWNEVTEKTSNLKSRETCHLRKLQWDQLT
jgi:hypothetical protein